LFPTIQITRQIGGFGLHFGLLGITAVAIAWLIIRRIEQLGRVMLKSVVLLGWLAFLLAMNILHLHIIPRVRVPMFVHDGAYLMIESVVTVIGSLAACVAVAGSMAWIGRAVENRNGRPRCCRGCGYDLRGNASGRCPECGTRIADASVLGGS